MNTFVNRSVVLKPGRNRVECAATPACFWFKESGDHLIFVWTEPRKGGKVGDFVFSIYAYMSGVEYIRDGVSTIFGPFSTGHGMLMCRVPNSVPGESSPFR